MRRFLDVLLSHPLIYRVHAAGVDRHKIAAIRRIRNDFSGLKVLDLGCGPGNSTPLFPRSDYTGIDLSEKYIGLAREKYPRRHFIAGDAEELDWGSGFDVILINSLLHHLPDEKALRIAKKAARALAPNGVVLIQEPLIPGEWEWYHRLMMKLDRGNYFRSLAGWEELLAQAGLAAGRTDQYDLKVFGLYGYHYLSASFAVCR